MKIEGAQLKISLHNPTVHGTLMKNAQNNHGDLMHPGKVIAPQSSKKELTSALLMNFTLQKLC